MLKNKGCCNRELAWKIKELGVVQKSIWVWSIKLISNNPYTYEYPLRLLKKLCLAEEASAWTVAELGELLPFNPILYVYPDTKQEVYHVIHYYRVKAGNWTCNAGQHQVFAKNEADARAKMLIYLIENKLVKVEDLNKLLEA